jgi:hypothetical protein
MTHLPSGRDGAEYHGLHNAGSNSCRGRSRGPVPVGTPVNEPLETHAAMIRVVLLDALWRWAPPFQCPEITKATLWIARPAVGGNFP